MNIEKYEVILGFIERKYGTTQAQIVHRKADKIFSGFQGAIDSADSKTLKMHVTFIAEGCAMYLALKEYFPEKAYKWIDNAVRKRSDEANKMYNKISSAPMGKYLFLKAISVLQPKLFGESAGFRTEIVRNEKDVYEFNTLECPYCKYCAEFGCPELVRSFCDSDHYVYGGLKNVDFIRTQTLGTGGDRCDFCFKMK